MRARWLLCGLVLLTVECMGQSTMAVIPLKWMSAEEFAVSLGLLPAPTADELTGFRQQWVNDLGARLARELPPDLSRTPEQWRYASSMVTAPRERARGQQSGSLATMLPEGLDGPPIVLMDQNALLAKGTPAALDQLREIVALLDQKPRMVNVEARLVDAPFRLEEQWGIDAVTRSGQLTIATLGNAPPGGVQARWRRGNTEVTGGWDRSQSRGTLLTASNVTTTNNVPAILTFGRMLPVFVSQVYYDQWGNRHVSTQVDAVFIGTELFVEPRINADDTVTMLIRPTFIEAVGTIVGPNGVSLPITQTLGTETRVTVRDGETMQIGGFERNQAEYSTGVLAFLRGRRLSVQSQPTLFVTPRIVRDLEQPIPWP